jgi:hypothetical protein
MAAVALLGILAIHYSTMQPDALRIAAATAFGAVTAAAVLLMPFRRALTVWAIAMGVLSVWYAADRPSNDRDWSPEYAVPATVSRMGDHVRIRNIRNFSYRSEGDLTPAYYDATYSLADLERLDLVTSYWSGDTIAHVFLTFGFRDGRHLAFSIETRRQATYSYSAIAGFFHHYELFYVVADERDLIGVRTDIRRERVYLYRIRASRDAIRALFVSYLDKVAALSRNPEWYNTLSDNCTTGILARVGGGSVAATIPRDWRVLLTGYAAEDAYRRGLLESDLPFAELRKRSLVVRPPGAMLGPGFSRDIRHGLPE